MRVSYHAADQVRIVLSRSNVEQLLEAHNPSSDAYGRPELQKIIVKGGERFYLAVAIEDDDIHYRKA